MNRRRFLVSGATGFLGAYCLSKTSLLGVLNNKVNNHPKLGINLSPISNHSTEQAFINVFKQSREWISQGENASWGTGPALHLDENGWVKMLEPNCYATTILSSVDKKQYPSGRYTVLYDGEGEISFFNAATNENIIQRSPGKIVVNVNSAKGMWALNVSKINPDNYIRNIRVLLPGFENASTADNWNPDFIKRWAGVACFRYMNFMQTNNSKQVLWADRPKMTDCSFARNGAPLELMVDLANRQMADPWFCIPHMANDDYVYQFAHYVKDNLNPALKAWVEYSNEVWNSMFEQNSFARHSGKRLGFSHDEWQAAADYTAFRSLRIFKIWQEVFRSNEQFVRVIGSQAAFPARSERLLSFNGLEGNVDVLAIAPYLQMSVATGQEGLLSDKEVEKWSLDQVFEYLENKALPEAAVQVEQAARLAAKFGVRLAAYEAGQHLVGIMGAENNDKLSKLLQDANADQRMGKLYEKYLKMWGKYGDLLCAYYSTGNWGKFGSWGVLRYYNEPTAKAHKYRALVDWAQTHGQNMQYQL